MFSFAIKRKLGEARLSELTTPHGKVPGPFFQFVATQAAIRGMVFSEDLEKLGADIILANTYHLHLRPGDAIMDQAGGLHGFMQWDKPITTDSGGYQIFSLGQHVQITAEGVSFRAPLNGDLYHFTPESVMQTQQQLGADIIMSLDVCTRYGAPYEEVKAAVERTTQWAKRGQEAFATIQAQASARPQALYGIVQGSVYKDLRQQSAEELGKLNFFGYSIGGELRDLENYEVETGVQMTVPMLPENKPRYLMGSGTPEDIVRAVRAGVDQFDCVLPIRNARHGKAYADLNKEELVACLLDPERPVDPEKLYTAYSVKGSAWGNDFAPFSPGNPAIPKNYTRAYVHHLLRAEPLSGVRLLVLHNIHFYVQLFKTIRESIEQQGG